VEIVGPGEAGIEPWGTGSTAAVEEEAQTLLPTRGDVLVDANPPSPTKGGGEDEMKRATLRQRMQNSLRKGSAAVGTSS